MDLSISKSNILFIIFILGILLSYGIFAFVQQSDRRVLVQGQLDVVAERLVEADAIYTACVSLYRSRENAPFSVRAACVESQGFVRWVREFSFDPKLRNVKSELSALALTIEEMTQIISLHHNSHLKIILRIILRLKSQRCNGFFQIKHTPVIIAHHIGIAAGDIDSVGKRISLHPTHLHRITFSLKERAVVDSEERCRSCGANTNL